MNRFFVEIEPGFTSPVATGHVLFRTDLLSGGFPVSARVLLAILLGHGALALIIRPVPLLAAAHAFATLLVGVGFALSGRRVERVAYVAAYICGSEVLWRMARAPIFWEFGKYAIVLLFAIALFRSERWRNHDMSIVYFLLLLPSAIRTLISLPLAQSQSELSFNLSGPFTLVMAVIFFSNLKMTGLEIRRLLVALLGPVFGIAMIALFSIATAETIEFTGESNPVTSGGYGPNQVSAMLGLGAVACFFALMYGRAAKPIRLALGVLLIMFVAQSALTFSRGGLYSATGAIVVSCLILTRDRRMRPRLTGIMVALPIIAGTVLLWTNALTGGALASRFTDTSLTHRTDLSKQDMAVWAEYPIFGAGPGMAKAAHSNRLAAHTEFSRILGEHGLFGLGAMLFLIAMAVQQILQAPSWSGKAMSFAFIVWSFLFMSNSAMRIAAPSFIFGLAFVTLVPLKEGTYRFRNVFAVRPALV